MMTAEQNQNSPPKESPDVKISIKGEGSHYADPFLVTFDAPYDPENPKDWPVSKKWAVTGVLSATGLNRIMVSTIMAPALSSIASDLNMTTIESVMSMSVYLLATAFGPLIIGPLSEVYGRKPVLHTTNVWFLIWNVVCGFSNTKGLLLASRLLAGFGASAIYALGGGVLGDVWRPEQRGRSLGLYSLIPLLGAAIGPIAGGLIVGATTWRWIFWSTSILQGIMVIGSFIIFKETYAVVILEKRAARLRKATGQDQYHCEAAMQSANSSTSAKLRRSLTRPMRLLMFHPIIQIQACLAGLNYGVSYIVLTTYADLWTSQYGDSLTISGLHYISMSLGEVLAALIGGPTMDVIYRRLSQRSSGQEGRPESHILLMLPGSILLVSGLFMYGWAAESHTFWLVVDIGAAILSGGGTMAGQSMQAYVIDTYSEHTGSASAATQFLRSLGAFGLPLFAPAMYSSLGYGWANSMLAFILAAFFFPVPLLLWKYGGRMRENMKSSY
jgi:multidrug resistance protein